MTLSQSCIVVGTLAVCLVSCNKKNESVAPEEVEVRATSEKHRPAIHFTPAAGWMNDPNGMFFLDGEYHLFYQYYPDSTVWGPMHWGHAVSKDLVHWERLPVALYPDSLGYIFSGSAVVDHQNTSGLGTKEHPPVVAIFTYHDPAGEKAGNNDFESQGIAYSVDKGRTWKKYENNPVLKSPGIRDFRDPKVSWVEEAGQWVMTLAVTDHIEFYGSPDLKTWRKLSEFGKNDGAHGGVWECPDLFRMKDAEGKVKYVLLVSINPGGPNGGSGTQYFVGSFDGKRFTSDTPGKNAGWIDYGPDDYAGVTFANVPATDGRKLFMGWMSNWLYAQVVPTESWRSATTVARELALQKSRSGYVLTSMPVSELNKLVTHTVSHPAATDIDTLQIFSAKDSTTIPMVIRGSLNRADFVLQFKNAAGQQLKIGFDAGRKVFYADRSGSTVSDFYKDFGAMITAPRNSDDAVIAFTIVVDVASAEIFFDDGLTVMTVLSFPQEVFSQVNLFGVSGKIATGPVDVSFLRPIW